MKKTIETIAPARGAHWVGDGFPVRPLFNYQVDAQENSPFLMLDYGGPYNFTPAMAPRGVGTHPHKGFETVTIVFEGEVSHKDSTGAGGTIGPGDVQWMTAGSGILHNEFHSEGYTKSGGPFHMVQLWVNLPKQHKAAKPGYQSVLKTDIPTVTVAGGKGKLRVIAGEHGGVIGPAKTFTPINVWDVRLERDAELELKVPEGHTTLVAMLKGHITFDSGETAGEATLVRFERDGDTVKLKADGESLFLVLTGEPINEPVVGYGPFVMNTQAEIREAINEVNSGKFGHLA